MNLEFGLQICTHWAEHRPGVWHVGSSFPGVHLGIGVSGDFRKWPRVGVSSDLGRAPVEGHINVSLVTHTWSSSDGTPTVLTVGSFKATWGLPLKQLMGPC